MGAFWGCCVIAVVLWHVGRKIARCLFAVAVLLEMFGTNTVPEWVPQESFDRAFKDFKDEYLK